MVFITGNEKIQLNRENAFALGISNDEFIRIKKKYVTGAMKKQNRQIST